MRSGVESREGTSSSQLILSCFSRRDNGHNHEFADSASLQEYSDSAYAAAKSSERQPGGAKAWLTFALGAGVLLFNHMLAMSDSKVSIWLLVFGPLLSLFGLAGVYDVRILKGAGKDAKTVPARFRGMAIVIAVLSLLLTAWLVFVFYHVV